MPTIDKCHTSGTATGPIRVREVFAHLEFANQDGPYAPEWDATAYLQSDYTITAGIYKTIGHQDGEWVIYDTTDGNCEFVGIFPTIPAAVGKWTYCDEPPRGWFAYGDV